MHAGNPGEGSPRRTVGGKGGGAPAQAQGGGRMISGAGSALEAMLDALRATP